jgi:hypothetical protein
MPAGQDLALDLHLVAPDEAGEAVEGVDAVLRVVMLLLGRDRVGEAALEGDQLGPVDPDVALDAASDAFAGFRRPPPRR